MCTVTTPIVNGLEQDIKGQAEVLRMDLLSDVGRATARQYGVSVVPTMLVFDGRGQIVLRQTGIPDAGAIKAAVTENVQE